MSKYWDEACNIEKSVLHSIIFQDKKNIWNINKWFMISTILNDSKSTIQSEAHQKQ